MLVLLAVRKESLRLFLAKTGDIHAFLCKRAVVNMRFIPASVHVQEQSCKVKVTGNVEGQRSWAEGRAVEAVAWEMPVP